MKKSYRVVPPEGGSPQDTRLDSTVLNGTNLGPFLRQVGKRIENIRFSNVKIVKSNNYYEIHVPERPFLLGTRQQSCSHEKEYSRSQEYRARSVKRAKDTIRRLVIGNFTTTAKFLTLTFNQDLCDFDINDLSACNKSMSIFFHLLRRLYGNYKYVSVAEFQQRGAVHYHVLNDLPYIDKNVIYNFWGLGFIDIKKLHRIETAAMYLLKYLSKGLNDERYKNKRIYSASKNLIRPVNIYNSRAEDIKRILEQMREPDFKYVLKSTENGNIFVSEYILGYNLGNNEPNRP
ncbi:hypothetical protein A3K01_03960 [candidate division WWE3 bacterium RIFOXYD1_FULL_43_17]|uniref:Replication-associated protein ORF2/G2P domain-containing protein n=2 Tax=Katanobacteria TaxID=422282 RepID=A0A1F4XFE9_UNCKA|nr:MAG: hypothetical protein UT89_C0011G0002 [Parcubacteria group bacterium GW2011_GWE1_40_20]KKS60064.1 MAG: hypothetical protein UV26_C0010G0017 [candidate division WWE3 bacterium GW2011_GWF2_42_42]OGC79853.1 MAG: hypothetical protein A3K01_03960 [candidate division WWE3 bacterium RIFOXYD1_FULL_43_17]